MCRVSAVATCAGSNRKEREQLAMLVGQECALLSSGWALDLGGQGCKGQ